MIDNTTFNSKYPCKLSPTGFCRHGGSKRFNYGFASGTAPYCRKSKTWLREGARCPLKKEEA